MKVFKKVYAVVAGVLLLSILSGCASFQWGAGNFESAFKGTEATFRSYSHAGAVIDEIHSDAMYFSSEDKFATKNESGETVKASGVMNLTIGDKSMLHVGSSAIIAQDGLVDVFDEYAKTYTIDSSNTRGVPFINKMVNDMRNYTVGNDYIILVRSQTGIPLATFVGNEVSYFATSLDKSTGILVDGMRLLLYRCDYSIIPLSFIKRLDFNT